MNPVVSVEEISQQWSDIKDEHRAEMISICDEKEIRKIYDAIKLPPVVQHPKNVTPLITKTPRQDLDGTIRPNLSRRQGSHHHISPHTSCSVLSAEESSEKRDSTSSAYTKRESHIDVIMEKGECDADDTSVITLDSIPRRRSYSDQIDTVPKTSKTSEYIRMRAVSPTLRPLSFFKSEYSSTNNDTPRAVCEIVKNRRKSDGDKISPPVHERYKTLDPCQSYLFNSNISPVGNTNHSGDMNLAKHLCIPDENSGTLPSLKKAPHTTRVTSNELLPLVDLPRANVSIARSKVTRLPSVC